MKKSLILALVILGVLILDQWLKIYVKTNIPYGSGFNILGLEWAKIHFMENEGMAFGLSYGGITGKLVLSTFRILMVGFLFYILHKLIVSGEKLGLLICFSLIIAGAIGNILDSLFYGILFDKGLVFNSELGRWMSYSGIAKMNYEGYAPFLMGVVVDMLYFPLIDTKWPEWVPLVGGNSFRFFKPIFNIADSSISIGVASILLFYRRIFKNDTKEEEKAPS